ncbi:MAG TPA: DUF2059 domain-containing protein [Opitutaceae bacterium]|nr:DUF2059 domain-containing protein [Opitutaceae bacterium]
MKLSKLVLAFALIAPTCWADSQALAEKLLDLTGTQKAMSSGFELGFKPVLNQMKAQGMPDELLNQIADASHQFFAENFKWQDIKPDIVKMYVQTFSEAELGDLVKFYESPTGKKAASSMPSLMQQTSAIAMGRVQNKMPEFQKHVMSLINDYRAKHPTPAPGAAAPGAQDAPAAKP